MPSYEQLKTSVQWTSFFFSLCFNSLLIYLILTKSPKKMGNYRYLMIYFSCFAMLFSTVDVIVGPFIHSHNKGFAVVAEKGESKLPYAVQYGLLCILCGCFGVTITFFAIHFVFRYFALERKGRLSYFHGAYFGVWLAIPVFFGIVWGATVGYFLAPTGETTEYLRESIMKSFNLTMEDVMFVGSVYWRTTWDGKEEMVDDSFYAIFIFTTMITTSFLVVCYYGILSYHRINSLMEEGESSYTKNLQRQLYKALVIQAIIPIVLMYLPVGNYLILPAFGVNIEPFSKLVTFLYAAYPAVDPLPLFFVIDNYRIALKDYFYCCSAHSNRVSMGEEEVSRNQTTI